MTGNIQLHEWFLRITRWRPENCAVWSLTICVLFDGQVANIRRRQLGIKSSLWSSIVQRDEGTVSPGKKDSKNLRASLFAAPRVYTATLSRRYEAASTYPETSSSPEALRGPSVRTLGQQGRTSSWWHDPKNLKMRRNECSIFYSFFLLNARFTF
jgi:hypothetical protein